jgi:hypothetical protein
LQALIDSTGWTILKEVFQEQVHNRVEGIILNPLQSGDAVYAQEFAKGEMAAFKLATAMPQLLLQEAAHEAEEKLKEPEDEFDSSDEGSGDADDWDAED